MKNTPRRKLFVAYVKGEIVGMTAAFTEDEAKRLFAVERHLRPSAVDVKWTAKKEVSFEDYSTACNLQAAFLAA